MPRDLATLIADRETPETLRSALSVLDDLSPTTPKHRADIDLMRTEMQEELRIIEGRMF